MTLSHDSYAFESPAAHGMVTPASEHEPQLIVGTFIGVEGESHILPDATWGRDLICLVTFDGYASTTALQSDLDTIQSKVGTLTGTLTETIGGNDRTFLQCTFLGLLIPQRGMFADGATGNWVLKDAILRWRQRARNT